MKRSIIIFIPILLLGSLEPQNRHFWDQAVGGELNYYQINKIEDTAISQQFILTYCLLTY
jgi:hypothetical protein